MRKFLILVTMLLLLVTACVGEQVVSKETIADEQASPEVTVFKPPT